MHNKKLFGILFSEQEHVFQAHQAKKICFRLKQCLGFKRAQRPAVPACLRACLLACLLVCLLVSLFVCKTG